MVRRLTGLLLVAGLLLVGSAASGEEHELPQHPHLLLIDFEFDLSGDFPLLLSVDKCVDIADNQALRLNAHHEHVHFGTGNSGLERGDNLMIPAAPFPIPETSDVVPWEDCDGLLEFYGLD